MSLKKQIHSSINLCVNLLKNLSDESYCFSKKSSSCGAHIRHVIDRMNCFINGLNESKINYDLRERDPKIEIDRKFAINILEKTSEIFLNLKDENLAKEILIIETLDPNQPASKIPSTIAREIGGLIMHNTHHLAIIKMILQDQVNLDENLGKAPSTIIYEKNIN